MRPGTVVIVGVGALGSHVALFARNWMNQLRVVDFDRVEAKNTLAQVHTRMGLGANKAMALQRTLQGLFGTTIEAIPHRFSVDSAAVLLTGAALVLDCTDNIEARTVIAAAAERRGTACLHGAVSADGMFARIVWDELFVPDAEGTPGAPTCEGGEALPFFGVVGAWMAGVAQAYLTSGVKRSYHLTPTSVVQVG